MNVKDYSDAYAAAGLSTLPIVCDWTKGPDIDRLPRRQWSPFQDHIPSAQERSALFRNGKPVGIGIIGGKVSGNLEILDIDDPELVEPYLKAVEEVEPGLIAKLTQVRTPRPGLHIYYRHTGGPEGNLKLAKTEPRPQFEKFTGEPVIVPATGLQEVKPDTLIETRGEGGYVVAPGSPAGVHQTGRLYEHVAGPALVNIPTITTEERAVLLDVARSFKLLVEEAPSPQPTKSATTGLSPGDDFANRTTWGQILEPHGWANGGARGAVTVWRRLGKSRGISATTGLRSKAGAELFCVFSTNASPFNVPSGKICESFSKFAAYAILNHGGDYSAAAKKLYADGFGDRIETTKTPPQGAKSARGFDTISENSGNGAIVSTVYQWQPFPVEVLPPAAADYVGEAAQSIDCDPCMVGLPMLATLGACIGNRMVVQLKNGYTEPAAFWTAVLAESGSRKSAANDAPLRPVRRREKEAFGCHERAMEEYTVRLAQFKSDSVSWQKSKIKTTSEPPQEPEKPVCRRFTCNDTTIEALATLQKENPWGILLAKDELSGFFGGIGQYKAGKNGDEAHLLSMHAAREVLVDRKTGDRKVLYVPRAYLGICGTIQPAIFRQSMTQERYQSGMAARFLLAYPPARTCKWTEDGVSEGVETAYSHLVNRLLGLPMMVDPVTNTPEPTVVRLDPDAKRLWIKFHDAHSEEQADLEGDLNAAWSKLLGYAARLAFLVELARWAGGNEWEHPSFISQGSMEAGIYLARWFAYETQRIYSIQHLSAIQSEDLRLNDKIRSICDGTRRGVTARDLMRPPFGKRFTTAEMAEDTLVGLVKQGLGKWEPVQQEGPGRPVVRIYIPSSSSKSPLASIQLHSQTFPTDPSCQSSDPSTVDTIQYSTGHNAIVSTSSEASDHSGGWEEDEERAAMMTEHLPEGSDSE